MRYDVLVIGGGLAGLVSALELSRAGHRVALVERKTYPFHKVCGEYVSNEIRPYVESLGVDLAALGAADIRRFQFSSPSGRLLEAPLDLGGFGISRYVLDATLYDLAKAAGVDFYLNNSVEDVAFSGDAFTATLRSGPALEARVALGTFGKRTKLDKQMGRAFASQPSPYVGVKWHIRYDFPDDVIALHNFPGGYCGMSAIEDGKYCLCYLTTRDVLRQAGNVADLERSVLSQNPHLRHVFQNATFLYDKPEVINEFSFAPKQAVEQHILMAGDAAGLITPLCGNGMAMAIHGAKLASNLTATFLRGNIDRATLESDYQRGWSARFARRLWVGRNVQRFFGGRASTEAALTLFTTFRPLLRGVMRQTHGEVVAT